MAEFVANPGMFSAFRLARNLMGEKSKNLSQEQLTDVAKLIMAEDPAVIRDALGNKEALEALTRRLIKAGQLVTGGGGSAAVVAGDKANPFSTDFMSVNAGALENITKDIKPSARKKILDAANIQ